MLDKLRKQVAVEFEQLDNLITQVPTLFQASLFVPV